MYRNTIVIAVGISIILTILVVLHYRNISGRSGTIIIPAGNTYLGPSPSPQPPTDNAVLRTVKGNIYPYTFSAPATVTLTTFPNDPYDMYAVSGNNISPESNVLIGIDDLSKNTTRSQYTNQPKTVYIRDWWKQFSSLTGVKSIEPFTNSIGLKGYTVKFLSAAGQSPNQDIFFEIPNHPEYVIHLSNGILDPAVFADIVDSVGWEK